MRKKYPEEHDLPGAVWWHRVPNEVTRCGNVSFILIISQQFITAEAHAADAENVTCQHPVKVCRQSTFPAGQFQDAHRSSSAGNEPLSLSCVVLIYEPLLDSVLLLSSAPSRNAASSSMVISIRGALQDTRTGGALAAPEKNCFVRRLPLLSLLAYTGWHY